MEKNTLCFDPRRSVAIARWRLQRATNLQQTRSSSAKIIGDEDNPEWIRPSGEPDWSIERRSHEYFGNEDLGRNRGGLVPTWDPVMDSWGPFGDSGGPYGVSWENPPPEQWVGLGFHADLPDIRDHELTSQLNPFLSNGAVRAKFNRRFDHHRKNASPPVKQIPGYRHLIQDGPMPAVENQGSLGSCTANAVIGMAELLILRYGGSSLDLSRMFLYKCSRRLLGWTGDKGSFLRTTIKALRLFGCPPESEWPYRPELLDAEPDAFLFAYGKNFQAMKYARLDSNASSSADVLLAVKAALDAGHPAVFGFTLYDSVSKMGPDYVIPIPRRADNRVGGHAVMAVGYNDHVKVPGQDGSGAIIIRNSWGERWGDSGYAYLPYWYVLQQLAVDFWTLYGEEWLNLEEFEEASTGSTQKYRSK